MTEATSEEPQIRWVTRVWRRRWLLGGLLGTLLLIGVVLHYGDKAHVKRQLVVLRTEGWPTSAAEVETFYRIPEGVTDRTEAWVTALDVLDSRRRSGQLPPLMISFFLTLPLDDVESTRVQVESMTDELDLLRTAALIPGRVRFPDSAHQDLPNFMNRIHAVRSAVNSLILDTLVAAHDDDDDRAYQNITTILTLLQALGGEPAAVHIHRLMSWRYLVAELPQLLSNCAWNDEQLSTLQALLTVSDLKQEFRHFLICQRALVLSGIDARTIAPLRAKNQRKALVWYGEAIAGLDQPWPDAITQVTATLTSLESMTLPQRMIQSEAFTESQYLARFTWYAAQATAAQRCLNVAIAAQRYRLRHGELPQTIARLDGLLAPTAEPESQLLDPFNGRPLRFVSTAQGLLIYSVGIDGNDDGGSKNPGKTGDPLDEVVMLPTHPM